MLFRCRSDPTKRASSRQPWLRRTLRKGWWRHGVPEVLAVVLAPLGVELTGVGCTAGEVADWLRRWRPDLRMVDSRYSARTL